MRIRVLWLSIMTLTLMTAPAFAQQSRDAARRHYSEGQALFNAGNFQAALAEFRAANDIAPHPVTLKSQAECLERLGRIYEAIEMFERYLAEAPSARDADQIRQRIASHRSRPGRLQIISNPPGAVVTLDGQRIQGATPLEVQIPAGRHAVAVQADGYQMAVEEFNMPFAGSHTVNATLTPAGGQQMNRQPMPGDTMGVQQPQRSRWSVTTPVWAMIGVASAALITGVVTGALALANQGDFDDLRDDGISTNRAELEDIGDTGTLMALVADISYGVAAAAAITGIILFFVQNRSATQGTARTRGRRTSRFSVAPSISDNGGGLSAVGYF